MNRRIDHLIPPGLVAIAGVDHKTVAAHRRNRGELPAAREEFSTGPGGRMTTTYSTCLGTRPEFQPISSWARPESPLPDRRAASSLQSWRIDLVAGPDVKNLA